MLNVSLDFISDGVASELTATTVKLPTLDRSLSCIRGTGTQDGVSGNFPWSSGVKAMVILFLRYRLFRNGAAARLRGGARSPAAALDSALSKVPAWLLDVLGYDASGTPFARRLFRRVNPERKRPGPVEILVNQHLLAPEQVLIRENNVLLSDPESVRALLKRLLSMDPSYGDELLEPVVATSSETPVESAPTGPAAGEEVGRPPHLTSVVIADSDLIVVKCITSAWKLDEILGRAGIPCRRVTWNWSDDLLDAVQAGLVDLAIYNTVSTRRFITDTRSRNVHILTEWGRSMGGRNFYVLARKDSSWNATGLEFFLARLARGATIIVPERSDMINNLLAVLDYAVRPLTSMGVKIVPVPVTQGIESLDVNPEAVLIHGQNVRLQARFRGDYHEVLNYDLLPERLQSVLRGNSGNSLIASERLMSACSRETILAAVRAARQQFFASWADERAYGTLVKEIVADQRTHGRVNEDEMTFVVKQILYETYRFEASGDDHVFER